MNKLTPFLNHKIKPYEHQRYVLEESKDRQYYAFFWEMGTGKSKIALDTAAHLYLHGLIDSVIIIGDKGNYLNWLHEHIPTHMCDLVDYRLAYWESAPRKKEKRKMKWLLYKDPDSLDIVLCNIEALSHKKAPVYLLEFIKNHSSTMMIIDESTSIKSKCSRTNAAKSLGRRCSFRRIMTGTPITQSPIDLFHQCDFLERGAIGLKSHFQFKHYYAEWMNIQMGNRSFPKLIRFRNMDELKRRLSSFSSRILKEYCLDLPSKIYNTEYVELHPDQQKIYDEFKEKAIIMFKEGNVTATCVLTELQKLHQIICGHVRTNEGTVIDIPNGRLERLEDILKSMSGKVIIWCAFQRDVELICNRLRTEYGAESVVDYYGKTPEKKRPEYIRSFQEDTFCRFMVGTAATGGKGHNLTACHQTIYYSNTFHLEHRLQSEDRVHRIGQDHHATYVDLVCPGTIDQQIVKNLRGKKDIASEVLDTWDKLL